MTEHASTVVNTAGTPSAAEYPVCALRLCTPRNQAAQDGAPYHQWTNDDGSVWTEFHRLGSGYMLRFPGLADFLLDCSGRFAIAHPVPGTGADTLEHLFLNQIQPLAASRQGRLALHGSAVVVNGLAVAFLAESGSGKSTLAASFASAGMPFLTDDGLYLTTDASGCYHVLPSHASLRLWQDSEQALFDVAKLRRAGTVSHTPKARLLAGSALPHAQTPQPLAALYLLENGNADDEPRIGPLGAAEGLKLLSQHAFMLDMDGPSRLAQHFDHLVALASAVPTFRLGYPRRYAALPQVRAAVVAHLHHLKSLKQPKTPT